AESVGMSQRCQQRTYISATRLTSVGIAEHRRRTSSGFIRLTLNQLPLAVLPLPDHEHAIFNRNDFCPSFINASQNGTANSDITAHLRVHLHEIERVPVPVRVGGARDKFHLILNFSGRVAVGKVVSA